jgi:hypothetical protein
MQNLSWYIHRLGRMSPGELAYRTTQSMQAAVSRITAAYQSKVPAPAIAQSKHFVRAAVELNAQPYVAAAEQILAGRLVIFDLPDHFIGDPPQWNRDPLTGTLAPLMHASALDYRDERLVGNIKYLWEPNRHLHIPVLAQAYILTGEAKYARAVELHISSWIEQCPCSRGPNWTSSLELAIRLINWSIAWQLLGGHDAAIFSDAEGRAFRDRWLRSVCEQTRAITRKLSRYSSANNHLIGETAGVCVAAATWNYWPQMRQWGTRCRSILIHEVLQQNAADGGNREQAFSYQQFVLDFVVLAGLSGRATGADYPTEYWQRIERMLEFLAGMMDVSRTVPMIGDADDGYVVKLSAQLGSDNYRSLLGTGALLFDRPDFARKAGALDDKTRWLSLIEPKAHFDLLRQAPARTPPVREFRLSGYYVLGDRFECEDEIRMVVDAGPLGYLSIAAHGHADALSIVLNVGGQEVLVDPGTYAYHTESAWRRYFRSTRAHNTVLIDDADQSVQRGNFMWSQHATATCMEFSEAAGRQRFTGEHDGYLRLKDPLRHRRQIDYDLATRSFEITDTLECKGTHRGVRHWHFAEMLLPVVKTGEIVVQTRNFRIRIVSDVPPQATQVHRGGTSEQGGWVSRRFGYKQPAATVAWHTQIHGTTSLRTRIFCEPVN